MVIRPAADETNTRDGRPLAQAGTSYVAGGPLFACEVKSSQWQRLQGLHSGRDGVNLMASPVTTTAAAAVAAARCWSCLSARADSLHGHESRIRSYDRSEHCPIRLRVWSKSQAIVGVRVVLARGRERVRCKVIAKN